MVPDAGPPAQVVSRQQESEGSDRLVARAPARAEWAPVVRAELAPEKPVHLGDAGGCRPIAHLRPGQPRRLAGRRP